MFQKDNPQLADSIILTTVDPKLCKKRIRLTETLILKPIYIYISQSEVMEMFNNIENKVLNNQILSSKEELEFIIITIFQVMIKKRKLELLATLSKSTNIPFETLNSIFNTNSKK